MLAFLTDEQISHVVAEQVRLKRPDIRIESLLTWRGASLRTTRDDLVLAEASSDGRTLVTYDQKTIPPILMKLTENGGHHSGVVFVDHNSIRSDNVGGLVQVLFVFYDQS